MRNSTQLFPYFKIRGSCEKESKKRLDLDTLSKISVTFRIFEINIRGFIDSKVVSRGLSGRVRLITSLLKKRWEY